MRPLRLLRVLLLGSLMMPACAAWSQVKTAVPAGEPTNAEEAAAKKAAEAEELDRKFSAWKAGLLPRQQAWETVLEANLGNFYLPLYKKDKVKTPPVPTAWDFLEDDPKLPRVLLIGDSVSRGYTLATRAALQGKMNVHRAPENCGPTANALKKLDIWLGEGKWDVIHFNFGIHDRATPLADYLARLEQIVERLKKTGAKIVWASSTPIPPDTKDGPQAAAAILEKNAAAQELMTKLGVAVNDLGGFITPHLARVQNPKDVHFTNDGYNLLGGQVAASLLQQLP